ncbi:MAG: hypothetical protein J7L57_04085, partial [Deltaproteobacteria bacterium]|nr:hypothetical protein [Candidatus Tharpella sp.]
RSTDPLIKNDQTLLSLIGDWYTYLYDGDSEDDLAMIRKEESGGRPIGSESFIKKLEKKLNRSFNRKTAGRPSKEST